MKFNFLIILLIILLSSFVSAESITLISPSNGNISNNINQTLIYNITGFNQSVNVSSVLLLNGVINQTVIVEGGDGLRRSKPNNGNSIKAIWHLDESGTDSNAIDSSINSKNLTGSNIGSGDWVGGMFNNSVDLDGSTEKFTGVNDDYFISDDSVYVDFWFNATDDWNSISSDQTLLGDMDSNGGWRIKLESTDDKLELGIKDSSTFRIVEICNNTVWNVGQWYHLYVEWNGTHVNTLLDGVSCASNVPFNYNMDNTNNHGFDLGVSTGFGTIQYFNGLFDDVGIYNESLLNSTKGMDCSDNSVLGNGTTGWCYNNSPSWTNPQNFSLVDLSNGLYNWSVNVTQDSLNAISSEWNFTILGNNPPSTPVYETGSETNGSTVNRDYVVFNMSSTDADNDTIVIKAYIDGVNTVNSTSGIGSVSYSFNFTNISYALHNFSFIATDINNSLDSSRTDYRFVTTQLIHSGLTSISVDIDSIVWNWTNPINSLFNVTKVYLDGVLKQTSSATTYTSTGLSGSTNYNLTIIPFDTQNKQGQSSTNFTSTLTATVGGCTNVQTEYKHCTYQKWSGTRVCYDCGDLSKIVSCSSVCDAYTLGVIN